MNRFPDFAVACGEEASDPTVLHDGCHRARRRARPRSGHLDHQDGDLAAVARPRRRRLALRDAVAADRTGTRPLRLDPLGPRPRRLRAPRAGAGDRPLPLRAPRPLRRVLRPGLGGGLRPLRRRVRRPLPRPAVLHAGQRADDHGDVLGARSGSGTTAAPRVPTT